MTLNQHAIGAGASARLTGICERLRMPGTLRQIFDARLPSATYVHYGFEETGEAVLFKAYLEFWTTWEDELARRAMDTAPFLLHLGLKWDPSRPDRKALSRYTCHPWLPIDAIRRRLGSIYAESEAATPLAAVQAVLDHAGTRLGPDRMLYLEVEEDDNPRRSFDVNLYKAGLRLQDLEPWPSRLAAAYAVPEAQFRQLYSTAKTRILGHIAGGMDRGGRDFVTLYYGMAEHRPSIKPADRP